MTSGLLPSLLLVALTAIPFGLGDASVVRLAFDVLARSGSAEEFEVAAFITRAADGTLGLVHWPKTRKYRSARWDGPLPDGVVAVVHTHPRNSPLPSRQDRIEARRLQLPFYVVSRSSLCMTDVTGRMRCAEDVPALLKGGIQAQSKLQWKERIS